jgi:hypothetical protein
MVIHPEDTPPNSESTEEAQDWFTSVENEREFHGEEESIFLLYELSDFLVLLYKTGIVEGYECPLWMCANHNTVLLHDNNRMQPGVLQFVVLKCFWQVSLKMIVLYNC